MILILGRTLEPITLKNKGVLFIMNTDDREDAERTFKAELKEPVEIVVNRLYDKGQFFILKEDDL
jgi:hypothetical protein